MRSENIDNVHSRVGYQTWMSFPEYPTIQKKVCEVQFDTYHCKLEIIVTTILEITIQ